MNPVEGLSETACRAWVEAAALNPAAVDGAVDVLGKLYTAYTEGDADLVEINPLILTPDGRVHALDAKVSLDDNSVFRHTDYEAYDETQVRDAREQAAHERGLQYVGLDGEVGIIANGAGLAMSTVDIVSQVGGSPANFLDIGGGANADVMAGALEVINNDPKVRSIFINIFGGITKGDEVANGIVQALDRVQIDAPIVIRLDGTNAEEGHAILAAPPVRDVADRTDHGRRRATRRGARRREPVSIFVDETTKVVYQGLTGSQGRFYGLLNRDYGTQVVAGTNPKKAGTDVDGIPIFANVAEAVAATGATASCVFIPAPGVRDAVMDAAAGGVEFIVVITEGVPAHDEAWFYNALKRDHPNVRLLGPNCPGIISPGKANIGITAGHIAKAGGPVGIVSRSGTLTYQALYELKQQDIGVTTCVGIGGDPVPGTNFIDCLRAFEADPETRAVMMIGEIGGTAEEEAAEFIKSVDEQAGRELRGRGDRAAGQEDGPRGRDRLRRQGHRGGEDGRAPRCRREGGAQPDRGRPADDRGRRRALIAGPSPSQRRRTVILRRAGGRSGIRPGRVGRGARGRP